MGALLSFALLLALPGMPRQTTQPTAPAALAPGDVGTVLDQITLLDLAAPFERTLGEGDEFGGALAGLGDTNGDGLQEFAIGAPGDLRGTGAVWIFALRNNRTIAEYTKLGPLENLPFQLAAGDRFGSSVTALGDLDGDGRADIAVGAPGEDDGTIPPLGNTGALYVLFLRGNGSVREHVKLGYGTFPGASLDANDAFGSSVAFLGDLDGNGIPDLAVGAPGDGDGGGRTGAVYVLFFAADGSVLAAQKISELAGGFGGALANGDAFGSSLASLGDIDGDGTHELAVGAPGADSLPPGDSDVGAVWILSLASDGTVARETRIARQPLQTRNHRLGTSLTNIGDLDGDGVPDLVAGAPRLIVGGTSEAVFVLLMNPDGTARSSTHIPAPLFGGAGDDEFGTSVASPGDTNGDGRPDLVVGVPFEDTRVEDSGAIVFFDLLPSGVPAGIPTAVHAGNSSLPIAPTFRGGSDGYGAAITALGELDGAGLSEIAVGAPLDDDTLGAGGANDTGAVWIHYLTPTGGTRVAKISANQGGLALDSFDRFGSALAGLGDLDGDGRPDLVVGAPGDDDAGSNRGALWILFLRRNGTVISTQKILPDALDGPAFLGATVESLGDLDGDGATDLAVGTGCGPDGRRVWILFLSPDGSVKSKREIDTNRLPGFTGAGCFGNDLAYLGVSPSNGARYLAVGQAPDAWRIELGSEGRVLGGIRTPEFGALAAVGDIDGDGILDTVAGEGNPRLQLRRANWTVSTTTVLFPRFATVVEGLGDLSGDGVADIAFTDRLGPGTRVRLLQLGGIASAGFEQRDDGSLFPLENGRQIPQPHPGRTFVISSAGANLGATVFDSTPLGPNDPSQDRDLLVDSGKVLILQDSQVPTQTVQGIFDRPNDDADGGRIAFDFPVRVRALSLELIDIDGAGDGALVRLIDDAGRTRVYDVPGGFTEDRVADGGTGLRKLDLTTLAPQAGFRASATAAEQAGFAPGRVLRIEVELASSGAIDDLVYDPYP